MTFKYFNKGKEVSKEEFWKLFWLNKEIEVIKSGLTGCLRTVFLLDIPDEIKKSVKRGLRIYKKLKKRKRLK